MSAVGVCEISEKGGEVGEKRRGEEHEHDPRLPSRSRIMASSSVNILVNGRLNSSRLLELLSHK